MLKVKNKSSADGYKVGFSGGSCEPPHIAGAHDYDAWVTRWYEGQRDAFPPPRPSVRKKPKSKTRPLTLEEALTRPTLSVTEAGAIFFGLSRNASYEAAKSGDLPTMKIGPRKIRVIVAPLAKRLGLEFKVGRLEASDVGRY